MKNRVSPKKILATSIRLESFFKWLQEVFNLVPKLGYTDKPLATHLKTHVCGFKPRRMWFVSGVQVFELPFLKYGLLTVVV